MTLRMIPELEEGTYRAKASGALPNGKPVVVNSDGTVSVVSETDVSQNVGTHVVFNNARSDYNTVLYDPNTEKVILAYYDQPNGDGYVAVGTVSGASISFGTPVLFDRATLNISMAYDTASQKVVIAYEDGFNSDYGTAIVGTVSGDSISFGSPAVFNSGEGDGISATYDTNAEKVVIAYQNSGNSGYGTAVVGTVSGTSISFGSPVVFESASSSSITAVYDTNAQKVVITYIDAGNSYLGTAVVGTVSGTSISFGTPVAYTSGGGSHSSAVYDTNEQKIFIAFQGATPNRYGTAIVGTVSGTSISFGSEVVFESAKTEHCSVTYDPAARKFVVVYQDDGNSSYGTFAVATISGTTISFETPVAFETMIDNISTVYDPSSKTVVFAYRDFIVGGTQGSALVFKNAQTVANLTAENYIGLSKGGAVADGSSVTVDIIGTTNGEQSGLTAGESYYVQTDGTLGTTAADPEVFAGTAISATELLVKG